MGACEQRGIIKFLCVIVFIFFKTFLMWTIFKVFIELWHYCFCFMFWFGLTFWLQVTWDLSSLTRDRTHTHCIGRRSPNHWTVFVLHLTSYKVVTIEASWK